MKIRRATVNERKKQIELVTYSGQTYAFPFARLAPMPKVDDPIASWCVDPELSREAVTYSLKSGAEGSLHIEQALDYNKDPGYLAEMLIHKLTVEAVRRVEDAGLSRREVARRLRTSVPQLYRLLDPSNSTKNLGQLVSLLHVLGCEVDLVVKSPTAA